MDKKFIFYIILLFVDKNILFLYLIQIVEAKKFLSKFFFLENRIQTIIGIKNVV